MQKSGTLIPSVHRGADRHSLGLAGHERESAVKGCRLFFIAGCTLLRLLPQRNPGGLDAVGPPRLSEGLAGDTVCPTMPNQWTVAIYLSQC